MAKINHIIVEYKQQIKALDITPAENVPPKIVVQKFLRVFQDMDDQRLSGMISYPLEEILLIGFLAILGNASTWAEMARFGRSKEKWLKKFLKLKNGVPSHDTFQRVFSLVDPQQLHQTCVSIMIENLTKIKKALNIKEEGLRQICVDGKEQRSTGRNYHTSDEVRNLQTLHVYDATHEVCLFSKPIDSKTNEIPVAQEVLQSMELKNTVVSFDALHTQRETIRIIAERKGDYVGGLKGNQGTLFEDVALLFTPEVLAELRENAEAFYEQSEKAHGRHERRRYYMLKVSNAYAKKKDFKKLRSVVCCETYQYHPKTEKKTTELRYYITSLQDVETCAQAIRGHWGVENKLHWHLDYSFCEDMNSTMDKNAFQNYSTLNKMALSICKLAKPIMDNPSIRTMRKIFGWSYEDTLTKVLLSFDEKTMVF